MSVAEVPAELASRLQPLLAAELQRANGEQPDQALVDYLLLLVTSGREQAALTADLIEFFGEELASSLGAFLARLHREHVVAAAKPAPVAAPAPVTTGAKISLKRTRDEPPPPAREPRESREHSRESREHSFSHKPDQARFVPGQSNKLTRPATKEVVVAGGRVQPQQQRSGRATLGSVVVVQRKVGEVEPAPAAEEEPARKRPLIVRRGEEASSQQDEAPRFQITFGEVGARQAGIAAAPVVAPKKRLIVTKGGRQITPSGPLADEATQQVARRGQAASSVLAATQHLAGGAKRQFGSGFPNGPALAPQQPVQHSQVVDEPQEHDEEVDEDHEVHAVSVIMPTNGQSAFLPQISAFAAAPSAFAMQQPSSFGFAQPAYVNPAAAMTRCRFFPQCTNLTCPYIHPTALCSLFPNCNAGESCPFLHPALPCRFADACTNPVCSFSHPPGSSGLRGRGVASLRGRGGAMRGGRVGLGLGIDGAVASSTYGATRGGRGGGRGGLTSALQRANTPCRFGSACIRADCFYTHAERTAIGTARHAELDAPLDISAPFDATSTSPPAPAFTQPQPGPAPKSAVEIAAELAAKRASQAQATPATQ